MQKSVADRDKKILSLLKLASTYRTAIEEGVADMENSAKINNNSYMQEVILDYYRGLDKKLHGMELQKKALNELLHYLDSLKTSTDCTNANYCESLSKDYINFESNRIIGEIKILDNDIDNVKNMIPDNINIYN